MGTKGEENLFCRLATAMGMVMLGMVVLAARLRHDSSLDSITRNSHNHSPQHGVLTSPYANVEQWLRK